MYTRITTTGRWSVALAAIALMAAACASTTGGAPAVAESAAPTAAPAAAASAAPSSGGGRYSGGDYGNGGGAAASPAASAAAGAASPAAGSAFAVKVASGTIGKFLTGKDGMTLYIYKKDSPNTSACTADCAANWPPFMVAADAGLRAGDGVTGKLTTFARADGSMQVAYNGAPLYYFVGDQAAGDTTGQDLEDFVVAAP
jgi:predicted lipoprotein with Yx(FWY)xxD motif